MAEGQDFEHDVFISYAHGDPGELVLLVERALQRSGLKVWRDTSGGLRYGPDFLKQIVRALERSRVVVPLISPVYVEREWCLGELFIGAAYNCLVPVLVGGVEPEKLPFNRSVDLGVRDSDLFNSPASLQKFCDDVRALAKTRPRRTGFVGQPLPPIIGGPLQTLRSLRSWPYLGVSVNRAKRNLLNAHELFVNATNDRLRSGYATFSNPETIDAGLVEMQRCLEEDGARPDQWRALGQVARPFNAVVSAIAFSEAKLSAEAMKEQEFLDVEELKRPAVPTRTQAETAEPSAQLVEKVEKVRVQPGLNLRQEQRASAAEKDTFGSWMGLRSLLTVMAVPLTVIGALVPAWMLLSAGWRLLTTPHDAAPPSSVSAPATLTQATAVAPQPAAPSGVAPQVAVIPAYCSADRTCRFPSGWSLSKAAEDCFGDPNRWREIYALNRDNFRDPNPDKVWEGETFRLPASCPRYSR